MVSIGTVFSVIVAGAVVAGAYAVYRNIDKVGGALSRGVETTVTNPLGSYLDNLFTTLPGGSNGGQSTTPGQTVVNPETILNPLPTATAQTPTAATAININYAQQLTNKFLPKAQASAKTAIEYVTPSSKPQLLTQADLLAANSPTPGLTQAFSIVDQIRASVSNPEDPRQNPKLNKFYSLFTLANKPYAGGEVIPLSQQAVQAWAKVGVIAREVYL